MKQNIKIFAVVLISLLLIMLPVCFAQEINEEQKIKNEQQPIPASYYYNFPGLVSWLVAILYGAGFTYIAIGAAVLAGGYVVYRVSEYAWTYYTAYNYKTLTEHAYDHQYDFPNIWKIPPSKSKFKKECLNNMNSKSSKIERYIQIGGPTKEIGRSIAYDPKIEMATIGDVDGKTIVSCERRPRKDITKKVDKQKIWKRIN